MLCFLLPRYILEGSYRLCGGKPRQLSSTKSGVHHLARPIAAYGALEVPTYSIDVTPFVPLLTDEKNHTFTIDVISAEDDHAILSNWFVSGLLQVITDKDSMEATTGTALIVYEAGDYPVATVTGNIADNGDVDFSVAASRSLRIESEIVSGSGKKSHVVWSQELLYSNNQNWTENTNLQVRANQPGIDIRLTMLARLRNSFRPENHSLCMMRKSLSWTSFRILSTSNICI